MTVDKYLWDTSILTDVKTGLTKEVQKLQGIAEEYTGLQGKLKETWDGEAARAFMNETSIDIKALGVLTDSMQSLALILEQVLQKYTITEQRVNDIVVEIEATVNQLNSRI